MDRRFHLMKNLLAHGGVILRCCGRRRGRAAVARFMATLGDSAVPKRRAGFGGLVAL